MKISHDGSCKFFSEDLVCEILFGYLVYGGGGGGGAGDPAPTFFISIEKKMNESRIFRVFFYFFIDIVINIKTNKEREDKRMFVL